MKKFFLVLILACGVFSQGLLAETKENALSSHSQHTFCSQEKKSFSVNSLPITQPMIQKTTGGDAIFGFFGKDLPPSAQQKALR